MTTETTLTIAEMNADAKQVYKVGGDRLIAIADKYGATTRELDYYRSEGAASLGTVRSLAVAVTGSKSSLASLQRATYAAIKRRIEAAQA